MKPEELNKLLASLHCKQAMIRDINAEIFQLSEKRRQVEGEFLRGLAVFLDRPDAMLLDSHHFCPGSPIKNCVFEITLADEDACCLFCDKSMNR